MIPHYKLEDGVDDMAVVFINARCKKILRMLLFRREYTSLSKIAEETKVSRRSIYYDLCKINEFLENFGVAELVAERGRGILIPEEDRDKIEHLLYDNNEEEEYVFSPSERVKIMICYIIYQGEQVYIEQLAQFCKVSRNTIFNDLRVVVNQLHEYDLTLEYETKRGYFVTGDPIRIRALFFLYFNEFQALFHSGVLRFMDKEEILGYLEQFRQIEKHLNVDYVEGNLLSLAALMPILNHNTEKVYFPGLKKEELIQTKEYGLIVEHFPDLAEQENCYLCLHMLGSRINNGSDEFFEEKSNQFVYNIARALVAEFEKVACVIFEDREELERALFLHINTSMYRYQYGIQIGNPMSEDIMREYPNLFDITRIVARYLEQMLGVPIPDSEVAYLALHFGAHLKVSHGSDEQLRILLVCVNGLSTGNMLKREIQKLLPNAQIVDAVAAVDVINVQQMCDLVISTVKINSLVPVLIVHPILTADDRQYILNHQLVVHHQKYYEGDALFAVIKKYIREEDYDNVKKDLKRFICSDEQMQHMIREEDKDGLLKFLKGDHLRITFDQYLWQDSIRYAGECLVQEHSIQEKYLDTIISQTQYYGPYMFLNQDVMLAHAKPEDGAQRLDVALTIFKEPVCFGRDRHARMLFTLAAVDQESHLKILKDILKLIEKEDHEERLLECEDTQQLKQVIERIINTPEE